MPENITDKTILYGGYKLDNKAYGWICILNSQIKPVATILNFDSGTPLRYIQRMNCDLNGNIFAVDDEEYSFKTENLTSEKRFLMLNNFTILLSSESEYKVRLLRSYIFPLKIS